MSITADELNKSNAKHADINAIIKEHLTMIDTILRSHNPVWGTNIVTYFMPSMFVVRGLNSLDIQRIVYSTVISNLEKRGFRVKIELGKPTSKFVIHWLSQIKEEDLAICDNYIYRHCV